MDLSDILLLYAVGLLVSRAMFSTWLNPMVVFFLCWLLVFAMDLLSPVPVFYSLSSATLWCAAGLAIGFFLGGICGTALAPRGARRWTVDRDLFSRYATALKVLLIIGMFGSVLFIVRNPVALFGDGQFERLEKAGSLDIFFYFFHGVVCPALVTTVTVGAALHAHLTSCQTHECMQPDLRRLCRQLLLLVVASTSTLVLVDLVTMGRMKTITAFMAIIPAYAIISPRKRVSMRGVLLALLIGGIIFGFIAGVTAWRLNAGRNDIFESWLLYWTGPVRFFDALLTADAFGDPTYGRFTIMAFEGFILHTISFLPVINRFVPQIPARYFDRQNAMEIGPVNNYNAFGSIMLDPYYDFGIAGVVLLGLLVGVVVVYLYRLSQRESSPAVLALTAVAVGWVMWSPITWGGGWQVTTGAVPFWICLIELLSRWGRRRCPQIRDGSRNKASVA